jgi:hypothetical protein
MICHDYTLRAWFLQASNRSNFVCKMILPTFPYLLPDMFFSLVGIWITYPSVPFRTFKEKTHKHKQLKQVDSCSYH